MAEGTKERILDIALELFAQNGYLGTSMSDIAKQLGFTKAALYKHYTSKQEILDQIVERMNRMRKRCSSRSISMVRCICFTVSTTVPKIRRRLRRYWMPISGGS